MGRRRLPGVPGRAGHPFGPARSVPAGGDEADGGGRARGLAGWRQGFISNITNPKVLVFYLAVLPQFLTPGASLGWLLVLAWSHAMLGLSYLHAAGHRPARRPAPADAAPVRRGLDATTGAVLLGFSAKLATEHV